MDSKPIYYSKTFWFNIISVIVTVAAAFGFNQFQPDAQMGEYATVIVAIINIILRFYTAQPISK